MSSKREKVLEQQRRWKEERKLADQGLLPKEKNLKDLTVNIAERMDKLAVRDNQSKLVELQKGQKAFQKEIQSNICPICMELMLPPTYNPILLTPCGHSICKSCTHLIKNCPLCRKPVKQKVVNISLQQIICTYTNNKHLLEQAQKEVKASPEPVERADLRSIQTRIKVLQDQKRSVVQKISRVKAEKQACAIVQAKMKEERSLVQANLKKLQDQLKLMDRFLNDNSSKRDQLDEQQSSEREKLDMLNETLKELLLEVQKERILKRLRS